MCFKHAQDEVAELHAVEGSGMEAQPVADLDVGRLVTQLGQDSKNLQGPPTLDKLYHPIEVSCCHLFHRAHILFWPLWGENWCGHGKSQFVLSSRKFIDKNARFVRFTGHTVSVRSLVQPHHGAYSLPLTMLQHLLIFGTSNCDSSLRVPIWVELFGAQSRSMMTCHGLRLVLLEQELKDDKSEKAFRSVVHTKFPYIKADNLPKGKYTLRDTTERLVAQFPTEEVKEDYKAKVKERQFDHHVAWKCSECDHLRWEHLCGQVSNLNLQEVEVDSTAVEDDSTLRSPLDVQVHEGPILTTTR